MASRVVFPPTRGKGAVGSRVVKGGSVARRDVDASSLADMPKPSKEPATHLDPSTLDGGDRWGEERAR